ncbi:molecular chaperone TorD family protein [Azospirillum sp. TSO22-1]|uniref:molecular chaperone TorD family protein n=1 Tax=Azospirillum sp. TSO22-1 TaxID=716789 RepID=UPI000D60F31A|nr:molecular chaperone TorD family protein [Azospirillum sp. TSO22-1]PWC40407.1 hypothetical protein TSO221_25560 [Azospirillum sp. TSO22-1]
MDTPALKAAARSNVYGLLAVGFRYPDDETFELIRNGSFVQAFLDNLTIGLPAAVDDFRFRVNALAEAGTDLPTFENEYLRAFQTNAPSPSIPLYEGSYLPGVQKARILLELRGFYKHFGLDINQDERDLEDSLTAELEFMQFLAAKQSQAHEEGLSADPYVLAQRDFLERHLTTWLPKFESQVTEKVPFVFYRSLAAIARVYAERDLDGLRGQEPRS